SSLRTTRHVLHVRLNEARGVPKTRLTRCDHNSRCHVQSSGTTLERSSSLALYFWPSPPRQPVPSSRLKRWLRQRHLGGPGRRRERHVHLRPCCAHLKPAC